jgi:hypothetical protein
MTSWLTRFTTTLSASPSLHATLLVIYYLAIVAGMFTLYGRGEFNPPPFVYQAF